MDLAAGKGLHNKHPHSRQCDMVQPAAATSAAATPCIVGHQNRFAYIPVHSDMLDSVDTQSDVYVYIPNTMLTLCKHSKSVSSVVT